MGTYLSKANTAKDSDDGGHPFKSATRYGVSAMQGWRQNMEDAHIALPEVSTVEGILDGHRMGLYGVFDGHGGPTVSQWIAYHVEDTLGKSVKDIMEECQRNEPVDDKSNLPLSVRIVCEALQRTFLQLDADMQTESNREEIRKIFEAKKKTEDADSEDSGGQYQSLLKLGNRTLLQAILRGPGNKPQIKVVEQDGEQFFQISAVDDDEEDDEAAAARVIEDEDDGKTTATRISGVVIEDVGEAETKPSSVKPPPSATDGKAEKKADDGSSCSPRVGKQGLLQVDVEIEHAADGEVGRTHVAGETGSPHLVPVDPEIVANQTPEALSGAPLVEILAGGGDVEAADADLREEEDPANVLEGPASAGSGLLTRAANPAWGPENCGAAAIVGAVIETPEGPYLVTANAGDSRCVLCRNGAAVGMSQDHKPLLEKEFARIQKAGGSVFAGRVDGNLNLSRTIGDLFYKSNTELRPEEQKITAFPDIRVVPLTKDDEFVILACDGIWDCVTNDDAVKFVKQRLGENPDETTLSKICEELCDHCLAGNPVDSDGGIGCDNMTCIIVMLNRSLREQASGRESPVTLFEDAFNRGVAPTALENQETKCSSNAPNQYFTAHDCDDEELVDERHHDARATRVRDEVEAAPAGATTVGQDDDGEAVNRVC